MKSRATEILSCLKKSYPRAAIALNYSNPLDLLVAVILSAQCTDKKVNEVTSKLFKKYKTLDDYISVKQSEFEKDIRSTGFYRNKAKNIVASAKIIKEKYNGLVPRTMEDLISLPGAARKTANIVLGNAYGVISGIAVDTHVLRISQRLRLVDLAQIGGKRKRLFKNKAGREVVDFKKDASAEKIEQQLMKVVPKKQWLTFSYRIIEHGRAVCMAQKPRCSDCVLSGFCPASRV